MLDLLGDTVNGQPVDKSGNPVSPVNNESISSAMEAIFAQGFRNFDPSPYINNKLYQWFDKNNEVSYDDLTSEVKSSVPKGTSMSQDQVNYITSEREQDKFNDSLIENAPNGFLSKSGTEVSGLLGSALSPAGMVLGGLFKPISMISGTLSDMVIPKVVTDAIGSATEKNAAARFGLGLTKTSLGASAAFGAMTPFEAIRQTALGYPTNYYDETIQNLKTGLWQGAELYIGGRILGQLWKSSVGAFTKWKLGNPQDNTESVRLSQNQLINDKDIDTSKVVDNSLNNTANQISDEDANKMRDENTLFQQRIDQIEKDYGSDIPKKTPNIASANLLKLTNIFRKTATDRTPSEVDYHDQLMDIDYYKDAVEAQRTLPHERSNEQQNIIDGLNDPENERKSIQQQLDNYNDNIDSLREETEDSEPSLQRDSTLEDINDLDNKAEFLKNRLDEIDQNKDIDQSKLDKSNETMRALLERDSLQNYIDHNTAALNIKDNSNPIQSDDVKNQQERYRDVQSDQSFIDDHHNYYEDVYKTAEPKEDYTDEQINKEFEDLSPEDREAADKEFESHNSIVDNLKKMITDTMRCVRGEL